MVSPLRPLRTNVGLLMSDAGSSTSTLAVRENDLSSLSPEGGGASAHIGAGAMLRQAREAAGLHIAALAVSLKVPVKKLEALEADRFDLLPDAVFVRALASSVCRTLKIEAGPVLKRLPQTSSPKLTYQGVGINAPFRSPGDGPRPSIWTQTSKPAVVAGLALLLGALVLILLPVLRVGVSEGNPVVSQPKMQESVKQAEAGVMEARNAEAPQPVEFNATASVQVATASVPSVQVADALTPTIALAAVLATPPASSSVAKPSVAAVTSTSVPLSPSSTGLLVLFTAKSESWVEVTDSRGLVVLRRILGAGEVVGATGTLPLSAVVGRADATQVQIRGKAFDLNAVAKDNVARFEVK